MSDLEQLILEFDLSGADSAPRPMLKKNVGAGPARLLRRLVTEGLSLDALETAAAIVVALDEGTAA